MSYIRLFAEIRDMISTSDITIAVPDLLRNDELSVTLRERFIEFKISANDENIARFHLPRNVSFRPETCSTSDFTCEDGLVFRVKNMKELFNKPLEVNWKKMQDEELQWLLTVDKLQLACTRCGHILTFPQSIDRALPLPSDNWYEYFSENAWCHKDCHSEKASKFKLTPSANDCLVSDFFYLMDSGAVRPDGVRIEPLPSSNSPDPNSRAVLSSEILCFRCFTRVGFMFWEVNGEGESTEYFRIYKHAIDVKSRNSALPRLLNGFLHLRNAESVFAHYFLHQSNAESNFKFVLASDDPQDKSNLFAVVWIMNPDSKVLISSFIETDFPDQENDLVAENVVKLMYREKDYPSKEELTKTWLKEFSVTHLPLPVDLASALLAVLFQNTLSLPHSLRQSDDDFRVGFLRLC